MVVPIHELIYREYWRPSEAARVLGRTAEYWSRIYDTGLVTGYRAGARGNRHINAESAREYLQGLCAPAVEPNAQELAMRLFRERRAIQRRQTSLPIEDP